MTKEGNATNAEIEVGEQEPQEQIEDPNGLLSGLGQNATSLKTLNPSRFVKVSNMFERDLELTDEIREELKQDFTDEMSDVAKFKSLVVINKELCKLGAEVGSIFIEYLNVKHAQAGVKKVKGRVYDGREIKTAFISESLYNDYFFPN